MKKNKILLLIILLIAAGFFLVIPSKNSNHRILTNTSKTIDKNTSTTFDCDNQNKKVAKITDQNEVDLLGKTCLYVGCSGFTY